MRFFVLLLTILLAVNNYSQNIEYRSEEFVIEGELSTDDPVDPNLGRFDAVKFYLSSGDMLNLTLTAEFPPLLAIVAPSQKYYLEYPFEGSDYISFNKRIDEDGTWFLSIVGDSTDSGSYELIGRYAAANSLFISKGADLCTYFDFISEHSNNGYFFIRETLIELDPEQWTSKFNLPGSIQNLILENEPGNYEFVSSFYYGNNFREADSVFNFLNREIKNCTNTVWSESKETKKLGHPKNLSNVVSYKNTKGDKTKLIHVKFYDYDGSNERKFSYEIQVSFSKK
ncbi:MAG: hypothetical protein PVH88_10125 [Ignavibacteria bacterium]|jgi:hypothetical protein